MPDCCQMLALCDFILSPSINDALVYKPSCHKIQKANFPAGRACVFNAQRTLQHHLF